MDLRSESLSNDTQAQSVGGLHEFASKVAETMAGLPSPKPIEVAVGLSPHCQEWEDQSHKQRYYNTPHFNPVTKDVTISVLVPESVRAAERVAEAVAAERERCAKIAEDEPFEYREVRAYGSAVDEDATRAMLAAKIREAVERANRRVQCNTCRTVIGSQFRPHLNAYLCPQCYAEWIDKTRSHAAQPAEILEVPSAT